MSDTRALLDRISAFRQRLESTPSLIPIGVPVAEPSAALNAAEGREESPSQIVAFEDLLEKVRGQFSESERYLADHDGDVTPGYLARKLKVNPEDALRVAGSRFAKRFASLEAQVREQGRDLGQVSAEELVAIWRALR